MTRVQTVCNSSLLVSHLVFVIPPVTVCGVIFFNNGWQRHTSEVSSREKIVVEIISGELADFYCQSINQLFYSVPKS